VSGLATTSRCPILTSPVNKMFRRPLGHTFPPHVTVMPTGRMNSECPSLPFSSVVDVSRMCPWSWRPLIGFMVPSWVQALPRKPLLRQRVKWELFVTTRSGRGGVAREVLCFRLPKKLSHTLPCDDELLSKTFTSHLGRSLSIDLSTAQGDQSLQQAKH